MFAIIVIQIAYLGAVCTIARVVVCSALALMHFTYVLKVSTECWHFRCTILFGLFVPAFAVLVSAQISAVSIFVTTGISFKTRVDLGAVVFAVAPESFIALAQIAPKAQVNASCILMAAPTIRLCAIVDNLAFEAFYGRIHFIPPDTRTVVRASACGDTFGHGLSYQIFTCKAIRWRHAWNLW